MLRRPTGAVLCRWWRWAGVEEAGVAVAESAAIGFPAWRRDGRIAPARVVVEDGRLAGFNIVAAGVESVVVALLLDGLVIEHRRGRSVDRLRVRASS
jgi:hypothetical protein